MKPLMPLRLSNLGEREILSLSPGANGLVRGEPVLSGITARSKYFAPSDVIVIAFSRSTIGDPAVFAVDELPFAAALFALLLLLSLVGEEQASASASAQIVSARRKQFLIVLLLWSIRDGKAAV
jgi:hypothetical protein